MDKKLIKDTIEDIEPSDEKLDEMYENLLMEKRKLEEDKKEKKKSRGFKRLLPLVAVFTIIISTTVLAYMGVDFKFLDYLNERNIAEESLIGDVGIDDYIHDIDKEIVRENGTLYIKQAIMDKETIFVYMSFQGKEGMEFSGDDRALSFKEDIYDKQWYSEDEEERDRLMDEWAEEKDHKVIEKGSTVNIAGIELMTGSASPRVIGVDGNKIDLVLSHDMGDMNSFDGFIGEELKFNFKDFGYYKTYKLMGDDGKELEAISDKFIPLAKGNWDGSFKIDGKLLPTEMYKIGEEVDYTTEKGEEVSITIEDIDISNISLKLNIICKKYEDVHLIMGLSDEHMDVEFDDEGRKNHIGDIKLKYEDEKVIKTLVNQTDMLHEKADVDIKVNIERIFDEPIDLKDLDSIIIWGKEFKLK